MPVNPTYPGLYIEELPSQAHSITPAPTSVTVFVGYANPLQGKCATDTSRNYWCSGTNVAGQAIQIFSFAEYEFWFGPLYHHSIVGNDLPYAVYQFFLNGGSNAWIVPLKPRYYTATGAYIRDVTGATINGANGITFTAKQLTDAANPISISIRNVRQVPANLNGNGLPQHEQADISITFGRVLETYRDVHVYVHTGPVPNTDPAYIGNQLKRSVLVGIAPQTPATNFLNAFTAGGTPANTEIKLELSNMAPPGNYASTTSVADYARAFDKNEPLDKVEIFNLLVTPGETNPTVWSTALAYCEGKQAFYIMDPPENAAADATYTASTQIEAHVKSASFPKAPPNGALYFPYLRGGDPLKQDGSPQPPSGFIAGVFARTDRTRGVWKAPAGLEASVVNTRGVVETGRMTDMRQGVLNSLGVNCVREFSGSGPVIWGSRTVSTENKALEQWRYVPVRRMALFIEQTLLRNLTWVVFEPNAAPLWNAITVSIEAFMLSLYRQQAFFGTTPTQAFRVQCDSTTTTEEDINNGIVNIFVGFRPLKPAEFVVIKIAQLAGQAQT